MSNVSHITAAHVKKLDHSLSEIRLRALENIISKLELGFECDCNAIKKELLAKLFKWFLLEPVVKEEKVLNLLIKLSQHDGGSYLNSFGRVRFKQELRDLKAKLDCRWQDKLNKLEELADNLSSYSNNLDNQHLVSPHESLERNFNQQCQVNLESSNLPHVSPLDSTAPIELTMNPGETTVVARRSDNSIRWLAMPWQILASSDRGILSRLEDSLRNADEIPVKLQSCQFITNIMLQDFPAEVFLQRPTTVKVLLGLLEFHISDSTEESHSLILAILKVLIKLTQLLRFRICYYCDPGIAHKANKILVRNLTSEYCAINHERDSPDGEPIDEHDPFQSARPSARNPSIMSDLNDSASQTHQMYIPIYCTETLLTALRLLSIPNDPTRPLTIVKYIADLSYELIQLLITSVMPTVWFCNDNIAFRIHESMKNVFESFSEILDYFVQFDSIDYYRATYIYFLWIAIKFLSNVVPLELADQVIPKKMKLSMCSALMDASIYLMYSSLHITIQEYARRFRGAEECELVKLLDETRLVTKSIKASISLIKNTKEQTFSEELKAIHASKLSLLYHKNFKLIKKFIILAQNKSCYKLSANDTEMITKITLSFLAHNDDDVQEVTYTECHSLVTSTLVGDYRSNWKNIMFMMNSHILTEIICHGAVSENQKVKILAEEILLFLLNGRIEMTEVGWQKFIEELIPVLPLLQCLAHPSTSLGKSITKMFDPDISSSIQLPFIEVLKGNVRFLFFPMSEIRDEALCRILWMLSQEKNSTQKLPRLTSLHGLPLSSLCVFDQQNTARRSEGTYQRSSLSSVLDMLRSGNVEPTVRKSALVQISVMLSDSSLHKPFIAENGISLVSDIFTKALIEKDYANYPDSVISIITILKNLASSENSVRVELSNCIEIFYNILRSLFLYPDNDNNKMDAAQLLVLLLYSGYIMRLTDISVDNPFNISLPYIITVNMKLPFACKAHWKTSIHRRADISVLHRSNPAASVFIRQFWAWEWNGAEKVLWKKWEHVNDQSINENLMIKENEFVCLTFTSIHFCVQRQIYNIQNSITHSGVTSAVDYLTMYLKLSNLVGLDNFQAILDLPWADTFERFLQAHPTNKEDHELFVDVLNFLHLYIKLAADQSTWLCKAVKRMIKSLPDWLNVPEGGEEVHHSILKLMRACATTDQDESDESKNVWINFVEFAVSNFFSGEYYNLAFLDWVLSTLTYVIKNCHWRTHKDSLTSIGLALNELILSFHRNGIISFMGLTITRDCIICLNHILLEMQTHLNKNSWMKFWYDDNSQSLCWLPALWRSRDPLVRASALQLLTSLVDGPHTALQLLAAIDISPHELCQALLYFVTAREESSIVKEEACLTMANLIRNSKTIAFQYIDSMNASAMLSYVKENNVYHEIAVMLSNCYMLATLDPDICEIFESSGAQSQLLSGGQSSGTVSLVPRAVYYLYDCDDDLQRYSARSSDDAMIDESQVQFITTPNLVTSLCTMLNSLITIGETEVIREIFEHSVHKYIIGCYSDFPRSINTERDVENYCNILEMFASLTIILTNCLIHSPDFASIIVFPPEFIRHLLGFINVDLYHTNTQRMISLRNRLATEIFKFFTSLSLTESQHFDSVQTALKSLDVESLARTLANIIRNSKSDLGLTAISFLAFLLSQEMQKDCEEDEKVLIFKDALDTKRIVESEDSWDNEHQEATTMQKRNTRNIIGAASIEHPIEATENQNAITIGADLCKTLINLFITYNYAKTGAKKNKHSNDREVITVALTNLLCISTTAKKLAVSEKFPATIMMVLKEIYLKLNSLPITTFKNQTGEKLHPLLQEIEAIYTLAMNFMFDCDEAKQALAKVGFADIIHKLWSHTSTNKKVLIGTLTMLSAFTANCTEAAHSLTLTTVTPGVGLRKTPNSVSLVHVIVQLIVKEIETIGRNNHGQKLRYALTVLRNAIHNHECRVVLSKSNLLTIFPKIHSAVTKRTKVWQSVEMNFLEFLIDFTFYDEGQMAVSKAVDSLEVLINLARLSTGSIRLLAMSILRNLSFNASNRPRLLGSTDFLDLLLTLMNTGDLMDVEIAGSSLWALVSNNQRGKVIARSAGFPACLNAAISRLSLQQNENGEKERELKKMLEYILQVIRPR
ncbi:hypothetical protein TKK_0013438 [Trichogramma kaykai]|uniref:Rotatin N-terminal domain-containing protein n=1 Tax=Trichogramma kaykai TaxID=54128 RepID=A0ABD2WJE4_9HYME